MILVVSYAGEDHTAAVTDRLEAAGREVARIDVGAFPSLATLSLELDASAEHHVVTTDTLTPIEYETLALQHQPVA